METQLVCTLADNFHPHCFLEVPTHGLRCTFLLFDLCSICHTRKGSITLSKVWGGTVVLLPHEFSKKRFMSQHWKRSSKPDVSRAMALSQKSRNYQSRITRFTSLGQQVSCTELSLHPATNGVSLRISRAKVALKIPGEAASRAGSNAMPTLAMSLGQIFTDHLLRVGHKPLSFTESKDQCQHRTSV